MALTGNHGLVCGYQCIDAERIVDDASGNGIGWAMWDYSGSFGVVTKKDGKGVADDSVLRAPGMK
jgi:hypothetical protein